MYSADAEGPPNLFVIDANGGEAQALVPANRSPQYASDWSAKSGTILFDWEHPENGPDVWAQMQLNYDLAKETARVDLSDVPTLVDA